MDIPKCFDNIGKKKNVVYVSDEMALKTIDDLLSGESSDENVMKEALVTQMRLLVDIRVFLRKIFKNLPQKPKVYKRPTGNKKDIIVGKK